MKMVWLAIILYLTPLRHWVVVLVRAQPYQLVEMEDLVVVESLQMHLVAALVDREMTEGADQLVMVEAVEAVEQEQLGLALEEDQARQGALAQHLQLQVRL